MSRASDVGVEIVPFPKYDRDLVGYGAKPPKPHWPNGARIALSFVLNYEEGGEDNVLHGDKQSEVAGFEVAGVMTPVVGGRDLNVESAYEYGSRSGVWRIMRIFDKHNINFTAYAVTMALERNPEVANAMVKAGHEIATHHYRWIDWKPVSYDDEKAYLDKAVQKHKEVCGVRPVGYYCGKFVSENSYNIAVREGGFKYFNDFYNDDLPYYDYRQSPPALIVPYSYDTNDFRFYAANGFAHGEDFYKYLKETFDYLYFEEGVKEDHPKMMSIGLHCRAVGHPARAGALAKFIEYVQSHEKVWIATREEIADHWLETHPPDAKQAKDIQSKL